MLYQFTRNDAKRTGYHFLQVTENGLVHPGVDYNWGIGDQDKYQPVICPTWGVVEYISPKGTNGGLGNYIVIQLPHNNAWVRFMHLDSIVVNIGETLYPNKIIGYLGDTGTTSSHLHGEVLNAKGLEYIKNYKRPYGRYTAGLSKSQVKTMWMDPVEFLEIENHYVGPNIQQKLNQAETALKWAGDMRRAMLIRLIERLTKLL